MLEGGEMSKDSVVANFATTAAGAAKKGGGK